MTGSGLPLGVLRCEFEAPPGGRKSPGQVPKSHRWLRGFDDTLVAADALTGRTRVIAVMDREADCFLLFDHQRQHRRVDLLVRAKHDRCLDENTKLFAALRSKPVEGTIDIDIDRITPRQKSGKVTRPGRSARMARCNLQYGSFPLKATTQRARPLTLQAVQVTETEPPDDEDPVKWTLLTSLPVDSAEAAREVIGFYLKRWKIEDYFRILKSGCRVEYLAFRTADRLTCAIAINAVIAWRIQLMTLLGREAPHNDPQLMFTDEEITFLQDYARAYGQPAPGKARRHRASGGNRLGGMPGPQTVFIGASERNIRWQNILTAIPVRSSTPQSPLIACQGKSSKTRLPDASGSGAKNS